MRAGPRIWMTAAQSASATIAAISSLKQSAHLSTNNNDQKIESHYTLAKIFWSNQNYIESYHHSDSAHKLLGPETKKYTDINSMLRNSKKIAHNRLVQQEIDNLEASCNTKPRRRLQLWI